MEEKWEQLKHELYFIFIILLNFHFVKEIGKFHLSIPSSDHNI